MRRLFLLSLLVVGILLWQVTRQSDEDRIRKALKKGREAIEREDLDGVMEVISRSYRDEYGLNFFTLRGFFQKVFATYDEIKIHVEREEVALEGEGRARGRIWAWVEAFKGGERVIACSSGDPCEVDLQLIKEHKDWVVLEARGPEEIGP